MQRLRNWVCVAHCSSANLAVGNSTDKVFKACLAGDIAYQFSGIIIDGDSWDEIPVPSGGDVFVFIPFDVSVQDTVRKMKTFWLEVKNKIV